MTDTPSQPQPSRDAREVLRVLRMFGAVPGQQVRLALLETLMARHTGRSFPRDLNAVIAELVAAGLLTKGRPDGVVMTEAGQAAR